jgi:hypothetical protein
MADFDHDSHSSDSDTVPEDRVTRYSSLCSIMPAPIVITGYLVTRLREHFAEASQIVDPTFRRKAIWLDTKATGIQIEPFLTWKPELTEKRPAVIIRRNDWSTRRIGIDDRQMGLVTLDGTERYSVLLLGSTTLFCIAGNGNEAERLGAEVYEEIMQFAPIIRAELGLMRFQLMSVGAAFKVKEATANYAVPLTVAYAFEECWNIRQHAPKLKTISLTVFG